MKKKLKSLMGNGTLLLTSTFLVCTGNEALAFGEGTTRKQQITSDVDTIAASTIDLVGIYEQTIVDTQIVVQNLPSTSPIPPTNQPEFPEAEPLPPLEELLQDVPPIEDLEDSDASDGLDSEISFIIKNFEIQGNTAFSDAEIRHEVLSEYENQPVDFGDLLEIEAKITKLYTENGYLNSGAIIPPQKSQAGSLIIRVIEGKVTASEIAINGRLSEKYIRDRLIRGTKKPFNINDLQEALQLLQLNPLVDQINAELSVGATRNQWELAVAVEQADAFDPSLFINNDRTPSVGSFQRGLEIKHNNIARGGETLSYAYRNTDGSNDYDFRIDVPFNSLDGTISFGYRFIDSDIIEPRFSSLRINSQTDEYDLTIRQPLILSATTESTQELAVGLEFSRQSNNTTIFNSQLQDNEPFRLSRGADDNGETNVIALRLFQDWTKRTRSDVFAARSQFSFGLDGFDATISEDRPDAEFFAWRGQVQWVKLIDTESNTTFLLRSDIQLTPDELVSLEQFSAGGSSSVRGYRQDTLLGDNGIIFSGELRFPFYRWDDNRSSLALIPFTDFGTVWSDDASPSQDEDAIFAVGLGLQLDLGERLNARLDWGIPLVEVEDSDRTLQENGVYFSLEYFPF